MRMVEMILATDMADHASHLSVVKSMIQRCGVTKEEANARNMIDMEDESRKFKT